MMGLMCSQERMWSRIVRRLCPNPSRVLHSTHVFGIHEQVREIGGREEGRGRGRRE